MYQEEVKRKIRTFLEDYKIRRETIGRVGDVQSMQFDFVEDVVLVKGTEGHIQFRLSRLQELAQLSIVH